MNPKFGAVALCATLLSIPQAFSQSLTSPPNVVGTTCNLVSGPASFAGSRVSFKAGRTGTIKIDCAVDQAGLLVLSSQTPFSATYRDSTGTGTGASVKAYLISISTASAPTLSQIVFNSNDFSETTKTTQSGLSGATPDFPRLHLVRVVLKRSKDTQIVEFYGGVFLIN